MKPADKAKANRFCDMKEKIKNTIAAYAVMFLLLIVFLYKPFSNASAKSAIPKVVSGMRHTVGLKSDGRVLAVGYNDNGQTNVFDWVMVSPDEITKTSSLSILKIDNLKNHIISETYLHTFR